MSIAFASTTNDREDDTGAVNEYEVTEITLEETIVEETHLGALRLLLQLQQADLQMLLTAQKLSTYEQQVWNEMSEQSQQWFYWIEVFETLFFVGILVVFRRKLRGLLDTRLVL